jgi:hypothetical protein
MCRCLPGRETVHCAGGVWREDKAWDDFAPKKGCRPKSLGLSSVAPAGLALSPSIEPNSGFNVETVKSSELISGSVGDRYSRRTGNQSLCGLRTIRQPR